MAPFDLFGWLKQTFGGGGQPQQQSSQPQPQQQPQKQQVGWNQVSGGYTPVFNTDSNPQSQYKTIPDTPQQQYNQPQAQGPQQQYSQPRQQPQQSQQTVARNPNFSQFNVSKTVSNAIQQAASKFGIPASLLYDIALQESSFEPSHVNDTPDGKAAGNPTGLYQFTDSTWKELTDPNSGTYGQSLRPLLQGTDRTNPYNNAMAAAYLIANGQLGRWNASQPVWGQYYSPQELQQYYSQTDPQYVPKSGFRK